MKSKEVRTIKSTKNNQRSSLTDLNQTNHKQTPLSYDQACLQIQIKIPKGKNKLKKQNKPQKVQTLVQDKINRKKQKKKVNHEFNKTLLVSESIENKQSKKDLKETSKLKSRTADKTFRNPSRADTIKKSTKEEWLSDLYFKNTFTEAQASNRKKEELTKQIHLKLPKQQYLFLGDEFYLVNNYCPTKRLLNTFREACIQDKNSKFVAQDRCEKGKGKIQLKRNNIFMAARKEIQMKSKVGKAIIIQKWWKDILRRRNLHNLKSNPQNVGNNVFKNQINVIDSQQITVYDCHQRKTSFQLPDCISQHQRQYPQDQQIVSSFNSVQMMGEPKKIEFKAQDLNQKLMEPYKLPQQEVSSHQNQAIFQSYTRFRMQESNNNESDQQQYLNNSPIHSIQNQQNQAIREESQQISFDLLKQFQEATRIKELIDVRIAFQKGQIKHGDTNTTKIQISTSILAIHNFLVNFFNYYIQKYREEFISLINMPFGFSLFSRLRCIHGESLPEQIQEDDEGILYGVKLIIEGDKLDQFYRFLEFRENKGNNTFVKTNFELQKIHHRAVLDLFNEELNQYRPYRLINGVPYSWNHSYKALTFYFVTEENIAEVFQKVQLKILKNASLLCGIILPETRIPLPKQNNAGQSQEFDIAWFIDSYRQNYHGLTLEHNEGRQVKLIHEQIKQQVFEYDFQLYTKVMFELSQTIFEELIRQNAFQMIQKFSNSQIY